MRRPSPTRALLRPSNARPTHPHPPHPSPPTNTPTRPPPTPPPQVYFKPGCLEVALRDLRGKQVRGREAQTGQGNAGRVGSWRFALGVRGLGRGERQRPAPRAPRVAPQTWPPPLLFGTVPPQRAFIVTDKYLYDSGMTDRVTKVLDEIHVQHRVSAPVTPRVTPPGGSRPQGRRRRRWRGRRGRAAATASHTPSIILTPAPHRPTPPRPTPPPQPDLLPRAARPHPGRRPRRPG
jgi:hypothetical protein